MNNFQFSIFKRRPTAKYQQPNTNAGFTLIEILLYLAIASFLLLAVSAFVTASFQARVEAQVQGEVEQQGEHMMQAITTVVRSATSVTTPTTGSSSATLTVATSTGGTNPTTFALSGSTLTITEGASAAVALANSQVTVSSLTFTNLTRSSTAGLVRIQFTLSYNGIANRREYTYSKVFYGTAAIR